MENHNKGEKYSNDIGKQGSSNADSDDDVIEIPRENRHFRDISSNITRFGAACYTSDDDSDDDSLSIIYESINSLPDVHIETNPETNEIIVDFLKKDAKPYYGCYSSRCNLRQRELGLCVLFNIGKNTKEMNETPPLPRPTPNPPAPPRPTALYCGICSDSHVEIFKSGKNLMSSVCGHVFCSVCLDRCPESLKNCLTCGKKLSRKHYHYLYQ